MTRPDNLSHLPAEVAGRIRAHLARLHRQLDSRDWDEVESPYPELGTVLQLAVDVAFLAQLQVGEIARLRRARLACYVAAGVVVGVEVGRWWI